MNDISKKNENELPSNQSLLKSTFIAAITACVLLITVVLPAEYGFDPTGFGTLTGLKSMGEIRQSLADEANGPKQKSSNHIATDKIIVKKSEDKTAKSSPLSIREDQFEITLAPNEGTEIKATLTKDQVVHFEWTSTEKVNFDVHGDSKELSIDNFNYKKGIGQITDKGQIKAEFDGGHGWFWRNRNMKPVTIVLKTSGAYSEIKEMK
jgi:hypothetical protein